MVAIIINPFNVILNGCIDMDICRFKPMKLIGIFADA